MKTRFSPIRLLALASAISVGFAPAVMAQVEEVTPDVEVEEPTEDILPTASIPEIVSGVEEFSTLEAALEAAELTEALAGEGPFTVFAPPNAAFEALPEGVLDALLLPENQDLLADVLTYHVVAGEVLSSDLSPGMVETLSGEDVSVTVGDGTAMIGDANIVSVDVPATNGVIHVIDAVLVPTTVATELESRLAATEEPMVEEESMAEEATPMIEEAPMVEETTPAAEPVRGLW